MGDELGKPLVGLRVVELAGGAAAAYCGRLLLDAGASVTLVGGDASQLRGPGEVEALYAAFLNGGKHTLPRDLSDSEIIDLCRNADLVVIGEDVTAPGVTLEPRFGIIDLSWFGSEGPYRAWKGSDLIIQALTGLTHLTGPVDGPPLYAGDRHSTIIGGATAYVAALTAVLATAAPEARQFEVSILEANLILSEMQLHFYDRAQIPLKRQGINRFWPNGPIGIYPCKQGWVGIIATTPAQWFALCRLLDMHEFAQDAGLLTRELRFARLDEIEEAMVRGLRLHTAAEWAQIAMENRLPLVEVPDAEGILSQPVFAQRKALASLKVGEETYRVPRTPFGLTRTPVATEIGVEPEAANRFGKRDLAPGTGELATLLEGLTIVDFSMGWAGPLATRLMADFGATVLKIEAARYPDWWRGVAWSQEFIETRQYELSGGFCALNRGKSGISLNLASEKGREIALALAAQADAVVENQAAGVMRKLRLDYESLCDVNREVVMLSMSAFGSGNALSETRAYGSTMDQAAGLPSFVGEEGTPPTMAHVAYADPVGGLFGCAAMLTGLIHKSRTGKGQWINLSMVETMLPFTTPHLLEHQLTGTAPTRWGNRHPVLSPHGVFPCAGDDQWVAVAVEGAASFASLARLIGREDLAGDSSLADLAGRRSREGEIEAAIAAWTQRFGSHVAACALQSAGIPAAPLVHLENLADNAHLEANGFFVDLIREFSGPQRQCGIGITQAGHRFGARSPAPLLGEHTWDVLRRRLNLDELTYQELIAQEVIGFTPTLERAQAIEEQLKTGPRAR